MVDQNKRQNLLRLIKAQPEHGEGRALVTIAEFFDGNDDLGSIGCNLSDHPGLEKFRLVMEGIVALPLVDQVWLQIYDLDEGDWPFSENVLIFGDVMTDEIETFASEIEPSEINDVTMEWIPSRDPALQGRRYVNLWWD